MKKSLFALITIFILLQTVVFAAAKNYDFYVVYDDATKTFTASAPIELKDEEYSGDLLFVMGAYENEKLIVTDSAIVNISSPIDTLKITCSHSEGKAFTDYSFKCFVFDSNLSPYDECKTITGDDIIQAQDSIAVISSASVAQNSNNEEVYSISYYKNNCLYENILTSRDVYLKNPELSIGDIIKLTTSDDGTVTSLDSFINFGEKIRNSDGTIDGPVFFSETRDNEKYDFNYPTKITSNSLRNITLNNTLYRIPKAFNTYTIRANMSDNKVTTGSAKDIDYWALHDMGMSIRHKYADYVFVRAYKNCVIDVVIVQSIFEDPTEEEDYITLEEEEYIQYEEDAEKAYISAKEAYDKENKAYQAAYEEYLLYPNEENIEKLNNSIDNLQEAAFLYFDSAEEWYDTAMNLSEIDDNYNISEAEEAYAEAELAYEEAFSIEYASIGNSVNLEVISPVNNGSSDDLEEIHILNYGESLPDGVYLAYPEPFVKKESIFN